MANSTADTVLTIDGEVQRPLKLSFGDLQAIAAEFQVPDVSQLAPKRAGGAVRLQGLLAQAGVKSTADYLTLHSSTDNFHASIPLAAVRDRAVLIYQLEGAPLPIKVGGPVRFFIPDHAACHVAEVDECANVKFVDRIELTHGRGFDNRPTEEEEHAELHRRQGSSG